MPGSTKVLGPWLSGLNLTSNRNLSAFLKDNELGEATNVIYTPEGFIQPRPGCKALRSAGVDNLYSLPETGREITLLGVVRISNGSLISLVQVANGNETRVYKILDEDTAAGQTNIKLYHSRSDGLRFTFVLAHSGFISPQTIFYPDTDPASEFNDSYSYNYPVDTGVIFFTDQDNKAYLADGNLDEVAVGPAPLPSNGLNLLDAALRIPAAHYGMIIKNRLFLFNRDKSSMTWGPGTYILDFRNAGNTTGFRSPFGDLYARTERLEATTPEDGLRSIEFYNNNFYIFKRTRTFMFTYQVDPYLDGYLRKISDEMGALSSTLYRGNIVVLNNKGIFRMENADFIDMQRNMNFRFEIPLDHQNIKSKDTFITDFNNDILFGYRDNITNPSAPKTYYYCMNGFTGGWSKWEYDYDAAIPIASPGTRQSRTQKLGTTAQKMLFVDFSGKYVVYSDWKPGVTQYNYHMDSKLTDILTHPFYYMPNVVIKTKASIGDDFLKWKKIYRTFIRFYLSEPAPADLSPIWTISINYDNYNYSSLIPNPKYDFFPTTEQLPPLGTALENATYKRTYQIPIKQQRATEFVFEVKRKYTSIAGNTVVTNPDADRPIANGYYFMLSALWFDYMDKG